MNNKRPTVGDLFCGAGGFSEGFRQSGFKILWALDNWQDARTTYGNNFRGAKVLQEDILEADLRKLPKVDVLIGGPPCTYFSLANKAGNGHIEQGLELVEKFADAVKALKPKYWIMENVPQLKSALGPSKNRSRKLDARKLKRISKYFPQSAILNSADFGVPQKRRRLFYGHFPIPPKIVRTERDWIPMRKIVDALPYPLSDIVPKNETLKDPLYPDVEIPASEL